MLSASVTVDKEIVSSIGKGVLVFAAVAPGDSEKEAQQIANKVLKMKLWDDEKGGRVGFVLLFVRPLHCMITVPGTADHHGVVETKCHGHQWRGALRYGLSSAPVVRSPKEVVV